MQNIRIPLILLAMLLFFADITIRRFGLKIPVRSKKNKDRVEPVDSGIEQLLKAKQRNTK
jgi:hypothetical protein